MKPLHRLRDVTGAVESNHEHGVENFGGGSSSSPRSPARAPVGTHDPTFWRTQAVEGIEINVSVDGAPPEPPAPPSARAVFGLSDLD